MPKTCLVCQTENATNDPEAICIICRRFTSELVTDFLKNNPVPKGAKPETSTKKSFYGFNWQSQPNTQTRIEAIEKAKNKAKRRNHATSLAKLRNTKANCKAWLCREEAKIADGLDEIGESQIILKVLEGKENAN